MVLAAGPWLEISKSFIVILCWIVIPVFLVAGFITSIFHYRKKKKNSNAVTGRNNGVPFTFPDKIGVPKGEVDYIYFDHSALVNKYKQELSNTQARNIMLQHDLSRIKEEFKRVTAIQKISNKNKTLIMETTDVGIQNPSEEQNQLSNQLEELKRAFKILEIENENLRDQLSSVTLPVDVQQQKLRELQEEKKGLKKLLTEQDWLSEAMKEKRAEISFLQNQLEQRVKDQHQAEILKSEIILEIEEIKKEHQSILAEKEQLLSSLDNRQIELSNLKLDYQNKDDQVTWLTNQLKEIKDQNELLLVQVADKSDELLALQEKITMTDDKLSTTEHKLASNKKMMRKLYNEFSKYVEAESEQSPVIALGKNTYSEGIDEREESVAFYPV